MTGPLLLALRYLAAHQGRTGILSACLAVAIALPAASRIIVARFDRALHARAATTPLVIGAKGSRFDLVFAALYFRRASLAPVPWSAWRELNDDPLVTGAIPVNSRSTAQGDPIVATSIEYLGSRGLRVARGRAFARTGEAVLGAETAVRIGAAPGSVVSSDQRALYDITVPPSLRLTVVGVLAPAGSPDDRAVFVDTETAWVLEGMAHGHDDATTIDDDQKIIARVDEHVALSGAVLEHQEITGTNVDSFHVHGSRDAMPLSAVLVTPADTKSGTILAARLNATSDLQAVVPTRVVDELVGFVVRVRRVLDAIALVLGVSTIALLVLVGMLAWRIRADELRTLTEIGCGRTTLALLIGFEYAMILVLAIAGAAVLVAITTAVVARATILM